MPVYCITVLITGRLAAGACCTPIILPERPAMIHRSRVATVLLTTALLAGACGDAGGPQIPTTLELDPPSLSLQLGDTTRLTARFLDERGRPMTPGPQGSELTWSTSDPRVALVANGLVMGVAGGAAVITASLAGFEPASVDIDVVAPTHTGQIMADLSGDRTGAYDIDAAFAFMATGVTSASFVVSFFDPDFAMAGTRDVFAWRARPDGSADLLWFWVLGDALTPGTHELSDAIFIAGYHSGGFEAIYEATDGSITFTSVTGGQFAGTFSISFIDEHGNVLHVRNGTFDVPHVPAYLILGSPQGATAALAAGASATQPSTQQPGERLRELRRGIDR
jgi:hypothetical protein